MFYLALFHANATESNVHAMEKFIDVGASRDEYYSELLRFTSKLEKDKPILMVKHTLTLFVH